MTPTRQNICRSASPFSIVKKMEMEQLKRREEIHPSPLH
jgi:hypothetical protein